MFERLRNLITGLIEKYKAAIGSLNEFQQENADLKAELATTKEQLAAVAAQPVETAERIQVLEQEAATARSEAETAKADLAAVKQQDAEEEQAIVSLISDLETANA